MNFTGFAIFVAIFISGESFSADSFEMSKKLYTNENYKQSAKSFFSLSSNESLEKSDQSLFYMGMSLKKLGLPYSASKFFFKLARKGNVDQKNLKSIFNEISQINDEAYLGQSQILKLYTGSIEESQIPAQMDFYFYFKGVELFLRRSFSESKSKFSKIDKNSSYYLKSLFYLGVIANQDRDNEKAKSLFEAVVKGLDSKSGENGLKQLSYLNIARLHYEQKNFFEAISYYAKIPRESDYWLRALFEASWAFFLMEKPNNALGNIHTLQSPFFDKRFFPETYVLASVSYLRMCRYDRSKSAIDDFNQRYEGTLKELDNFLVLGKNDPIGFFKVIYNARTNQEVGRKYILEILDDLSRTDAYKEAAVTVMNTDNEILKLKTFESEWKASGLFKNLSEFLSKKKQIAIKDAARRLLARLNSYKEYMDDLSEQSKLVVAEALLGKVDVIKEKLNFSTQKKETNFIGGMQPLEIGQELEYWPFEGEYWEDELGAYVYNVASNCKK